MISLNTYNYQEVNYLKPISYQVTVSDNDKIIKIEDDGDLIAELSFDVNGNTLILNGKDGIEVAEVELPIALADIVEQRYNEETKEIELKILKTNGESVTFGLDVAELVNVYTAGDGIDISDNVISVKIKDENGPLHVDSEGLDINLDEIASSTDISNLTNEIARLDEEITSAKDDIEILRNDISSEAEIRELEDNNIRTLINANKEELDSADERLQAQIGNVSDELTNSITEEIKSLREEINAVSVGASSALAQEIDKINTQIDDIIQTHNEDILSESTARTEKDDELQNEIDSLNASVGGLNDSIDELASNASQTFDEISDKIDEEISKQADENDNIKSLIDAETQRATSAETELSDRITTEEENRLTSDELIHTQISVLENTVKNLSNNLDSECEARELGDNQSLNEISNEREDRQAADTEVELRLTTAIENLEGSIKLKKDEDNNLKYTLYVNGNPSGEILIPKDCMIDDVIYNDENKTLTFVWNTQTPRSTVINLSDLVDAYLAGDGLILENNTFRVSITDSKYIGINENGGIEFIGAFVKRSDSPWIYDLIGTNGSNNGKFIDFTSDVDSYTKNIQDVYATKAYSDNQDKVVKAELIGNADDGYLTDSLYGVRAAIKKSEDETDAKISTEKNRAIFAETKLDSDVTTLRNDVVAYIKQQINNVKSDIQLNEEKNASAHTEMADNIKANSEILASVTNGENTGTLDKLNRQFHEITRDIDENKFEGLIKSLMDRITQLEETIALLTNSASVSGSIAYSIASAVNETKNYADEQATNATSNAVDYANRTFQVIGDYVTNDELESKNYVDDSTLNTTLNNYVTKTDLIAENYVSESELTTTLGNYVTSSYASANYQPTGDYVTNSALNAKNYATESYVGNVTKDMLTTASTIDSSSIKLSDDFFVADTFSQGLPIGGDTLDSATKKLSLAIRDLYDVTDGETFTY